MHLLGILMAGLSAGFVLGFVGAGGTIVGIPFFLYVAEVDPHHTFGTNALGVAATGVVLLVARGVRGELRYGPGVAVAIPGLVGIAVGTRLGMSVSGQNLVFLLGFVVLVVAGYIFYLSTRSAEPPEPDTAPERDAESPTHRHPDEREHPGRPSPDRAVAGGRTSPPDAPSQRGGSVTTGAPGPVGAIAALSRRAGMSGSAWARTVPLGLVIGTVAGFFGIGGGFMIVPGTSWAARIDLKAAAAASLIPITAFAGLVGGEYAAAGSASLPRAGLMAAAGVVAGGLGIWLSTVVSTRRFQQAFAGFLVLLGIYMIVQQ